MCYFQVASKGSKCNNPKRNFIEIGYMCCLFRRLLDSLADQVDLYTVSNLSVELKSL